MASDIPLPVDRPLLKKARPALKMPIAGFARGCKPAGEQVAPTQRRIE
jgi:hypothetical protein